MHTLIRFIKSIPITTEDLKGALVLLVCGGMLLGLIMMLPKYIQIMDEYRGMQDEILAEIDNK